MRKKIVSAVLGLGLSGTALLFTAGSAQGHGFSQDPMSRQGFCANGTVTDCGAIQHEPQSVEGPKGFPAAGPEDGLICSGGNEGFKQLDDPRGGDWPTTKVTAGENFTFTWKLTAAHATTDFQYYVTKDGWDPSKPLTRADLESEPFLTVPMDGKQPPSEWSAEGQLPEGKSGQHMILGVWNIADTANAFYACSDVEF
ncbi:chitin-binding protein [Streptomyces sp. AJS327]|uniref:lytic polysaccharide monooxygenase auxiliary activity family 9 protein n=1 Tax=Streptomyces sp. AJS327 TaxID=2545265 RepID=UPI0015DED30F|nr:lytic polysaccharide monooxygenase auxiliary activity family 9 protein [Streptomyces sp. AJS327]MBA0049635.1 chitin-binding protein [Streptomyces sp. AJS327]